jgi:chromatin segregation and condensation protein Rec8/ScpA/Scc1 (kleisin family)
MSNYEDEYAEMKAALGQMLAEQKAIIQKYSGRVINPDNSDEYKEAKKKFDAADKAVKVIEKELAEIEVAKNIPSKSVLDKIGEIIGKLTGDDDEGKDSVATGVRG